MPRLVRDADMLRKLTPYTAFRTPEPLPGDGTLSHPVWERASRTPAFVDMATGQPAFLKTEAAVLWDADRLHIGFWIEEPYPRAMLTERDSLIFRENDVEVFIDGGDCYYEFEINALGTVYEVFFIWRDAYPGHRFVGPEFDVVARDAYSFAGDFDRKPESFWKGTHPRGARWAFLDWDFPDMRSAVHVNGPINSDRPAQGWTVEVSFPWKGMVPLAGERSVPPLDGDVWRLFLGRFQQIPIGQGSAQAAWCASPHGVYDTHMPEKFTPVRFSSTLA